MVGSLKCSTAGLFIIWSKLEGNDISTVEDGKHQKLTPSATIPSKPPISLRNHGLLPVPITPHGGPALARIYRAL